MLNYTRESVAMSFDSVMNQDANALKKVAQKEEYINYLNKQISKYISSVVRMEMTEQESENIRSYYTIVGNIERIGDHAINIAEYSKTLKESDLSFSQAAMDELKKMKDICIRTLDDISLSGNKEIVLALARKNEQKIDDMNDEYWGNQIARMHNASCDPESGIFYSKILTDFERIGDHALNIAQSYKKMYT